MSAAGLPPVSVVMPTLGRSPVLGDAVASVLASDHPEVELVLVVNGDADVPPAARARAGGRVVVVREPRRGAARARNTGARHAGGPVLFFADDDVLLAPRTVPAAVEPLLRPRVGGVTGRILPAAVESDAQRLLEQYGGYDKGPDVLEFTAGDFRRGGRLYPFLPGRLGSGAAVAVRRSTFEGLGGFDERLGPGTPTRGAEDLDLLVRILRAGLLVRYEPSAVVLHCSRPQLRDLPRHLRGYGIGMGALATKEALRDPPAAARMLARVPAGLRHALSPASAKNAAKTAYPWQLTAHETAGLFLGPLALAGSAARDGWRGRARARRGQP